MKTNELAFYNGRFYRLSNTLLAQGITMMSMLAVGWVFDTMIAEGHLVLVENPAEGPDTFDCDKAAAARACACGFCLALNSERKMGELSTKVNTSAVSEAIRQVLEVSDTSRILIELLARRDAHGKAKYGTSLDRTDLSLVDWLQHQTEELLDGAGYAQAAKREAEKLLALEEPLRKLIDHLQENPPRIHNPSLRALVDLLQ